MIFPLFFPKLVSDENFLSTSKLTLCFLEKRPSQLFSCVCIPAFPPQELPPWELQTPFTPTIVLRLTESLILYFRLVVFPFFLLFVSCFSFICSSLSYWHWWGCCSWAHPLEASPWEIPCSPASPPISSTSALSETIPAPDFSDPRTVCLIISLRTYRPTV